MDNNKWLEIEIQINNDTFQSIDHTDYTGFEDDHYVFHRLQYVKDDDDYTEEAFSILKAETPEELQNPWEVPNIPDGLHYYQKLILPTSQHPISGENESIWYDEETGYVCIVDEDDPTSWETYNPYTQFDDIYQWVVRYEADNYFHFDQFCFSMYNLIKCYIMKERERINAYLRNNCKKPCITMESNMDSDLLLSIIIVLDYLIHKEYEEANFFEALRLFNGISSCGNLCTDLKVNNGGCGCGGAKN